MNNQTHRRRQPEAQSRPDIIFVSQNIDKRPDNLRVIYQIIRDKPVEVILVQEPLSGKRRFPKLAGFIEFSPVTTWSAANETPRVCTYVRTASCLDPILLPSPISGHRDMLIV